MLAHANVHFSEQMNDIIVHDAPINVNPHHSPPPPRDTLRNVWGFDFWKFLQVIDNLPGTPHDNFPQVIYTKIVFSILPGEASCHTEINKCAWGFQVPRAIAFCISLYFPAKLPENGCSQIQIWSKYSRIPYEPHCGPRGRWTLFYLTGVWWPDH